MHFPTALKSLSSLSHSKPASHVPLVSQGPPQLSPWTLAHTWQHPHTSDAKPPLQFEGAAGQLNVLHRMQLKASEPLRVTRMRAKPRMTREFILSLFWSRFQSSFPALCSSLVSSAWIASLEWRDCAWECSICRLRWRWNRPLTVARRKRGIKSFVYGIIDFCAELNISRGKWNQRKIALNIIFFVTRKLLELHFRWTDTIKAIVYQGAWWPCAYSLAMSTIGDGHSINRYITRRHFQGLCLRKRVQIICVCM